MGNHFGRSMTIAAMHCACLLDVAPNEFVSVCGDADIRIHFDVVKPRYRRPPFYALGITFRVMGRLVRVLNLQCKSAQQIHGLDLW
ncbi:hypothetical protein T07_8433 [Trichinella nelsoni]|uniref:Uncharacterized protein n=1 Tax=Trichinella nelsoni TaxID=6336 RepID=A0A0V0RXF7_9BILA|nr:hypothetical protein T07_8433 [Trichinella nelsoni]